MPLSELTTLRLGGPAGRLITATNERAVIAAVRAADEAHEPLLLLAGGSNVVVSDAGFPGTVVRILTTGIESGHGGYVTVQAGEPWDPFVERCVRSGLAGVECLSGIPGSAGATPIQNVGAYGQEVSEVITSVRVYDRHAEAVADLSCEDCEFAYRQSVFKRNPSRWVVLAVSYRLDRQSRSRPIRYDELAHELSLSIGDDAPPEEVRDAVLVLRRRKGMVIDSTDPDSVSAGSFFTNPALTSEEFARFHERVRVLTGGVARPRAFPTCDGRVKIAAAWLVEHAGFCRGYGSSQGIAISSKHTLALTNRGGGTTTELVALARKIADGVWRTFGVELLPEPVLVGHAWTEEGVAR